MTPEQLKQWKDYACIPRCLIKLTEMNGRPVTPVDFRARFAHLFSDPIKKYGLFPEGLIQTVLDPLSLPQNVTISPDYSVVQSTLAHRPLALMFSHIDLNPGHTNVIHHCSVLTRMNPTGFAIWTPNQDGSDVAVSFVRADWANKQCSAFILG